MEESLRHQLAQTVYVGVMNDLVREKNDMLSSPMRVELAQKAKNHVEQCPDCTQAVLEICREKLTDLTQGAVRKYVLYSRGLFDENLRKSEIDIIEAQERYPMAVAFAKIALEEGCEYALISVQEHVFPDRNPVRYYIHKEE